MALSLGGVGMVHAQANTYGTNSLVPSSYSSGAANGGTTTGAGTFGTTGVMNSSNGGSSSTTGVSRTTSSTGGSTSTPGIPNTGAAGDATTNLIVLGLAAIAAIFAGAYLWRQRSRLD